MADSGDRERTGDGDADSERVAGGDADTADDEWQFSVDEFDEPARDKEGWDDPETGHTAEETDGSRENPEGSEEDGRVEPLDEPLEPGDIDLENAFFVLLGVCLVVGLVLGAMVGL